MLFLRSTECIVLQKLTPQRPVVTVFDTLHGKFHATAPEKILDCLWPGTICRINLAEACQRTQKIVLAADKVMLAGVQLTVFAWLQFLLKFCNFILMPMQSCSRSYELLTTALRLPWNSLGLSEQSSIAHLILLQLMTYHGFINFPGAQELEYFFSQLRENNIDVSKKNTVDFSPNIPVITSSQAKKLLFQGADGLDKAGLQLFLKLLKGF